MKRTFLGILNPVYLESFSLNVWFLYDNKRLFTFPFILFAKFCYEGGSFVLTNEFSILIVKVVKRYEFFCDDTPKEVKTVIENLI